MLVANYVAVLKLALASITEKNGILTGLVELKYQEKVHKTSFSCETLKCQAKRGILSYTNSIFGPLGILLSIILEPKLITQSLCKEEVDLDDEISCSLKNRFENWKENL